MNEVELELARKLVASKRWRWIPGMRAWSGCYGYDEPEAFDWRFLAGTEVVVRADADGDVSHNEANERHAECATVSDIVPDLSDAATCGCLWDMLMDAVPYDAELTEFRDGSTHAGARQRWSKFGETRGEALARALLAAWSEP